TGALPSLSLLSVPNRGTGGIFFRVVQASGPGGTGVLHHDYFTLHSPSRKANGTVFELSKGTWSGGRGRPVRGARLPVCGFLQAEPLPFESAPKPLQRISMKNGIRSFTWND